jgi:hypothetical protein
MLHSQNFSLDFVHSRIYSVPVEGPKKVRECLARDYTDKKTYASVVSAGGDAGHKRTFLLVVRDKGDRDTRLRLE